jgi:adenine-specific DNA-methyltransferase
MYEDPYLTTQLIAYIGNKRRLLDFLGPLFRRLTGNYAAPKRVRFLDPFAGSGAVSRLGKHLGYQVEANDWEFFSYVLNEAHVGVDAKEAKRLFGGPGGLDALLARLNRQAERAPAPGYIARHYAPRETASADYRRERLFYTRENAVFLDTVRDEVERLYPGWRLSESAWREKLLLLAAILYQAATHANTSGVFKAYHKGFGGHGGDALHRILRPMALEHPVLADSAARCAASQEEAVGFVSSRPADIVYLDPPYNSHQFGSNYFMLNTIARWDKPSVDESRTEDGMLRVKAGIRPDWSETRSAFCYRDSGPRAFADLLDAIDARYIVLSYNSEGIVPLEELVDILAPHGRLELVTRDYVTYRGGRQSMQRATNNAELAFVLHRRESPGLWDRSRIEATLLERRLQGLLRARFSPERLGHLFPVEGNTVTLLPGRLSLRTEARYRFLDSVGDLSDLDTETLQQLLERLERCRLQDHREEARLLMRMLADGAVDDPTARRAYRERMIRCLRKFAHKKYHREFLETAEEIRSYVRSFPERFPGVEADLCEVEAQFRKRVAG